MTCNAARPHGPSTKAENPRDVDPSITGQPHQVTGEVPDLMGEFTRTLGTWADVPAAVPHTGAAATRALGHHPPAARESTSPAPSAAHPHIGP